MQQYQLSSPAETARFAALLGAHLQAGDTIILKGELAAGKTFFVTELARALGSDDYISSPTYTIANFYNLAGDTRLLHMDAYRIESVAEFRDLGLDEDFEECITLIEWGTKFADDFEQYLTIGFDFVANEKEARLLTLRPTGPRWQALLSALKFPAHV